MRQPFKKHYLQYLALFVDLYAELGRSPTIRELTDDPRSHTQSSSVVFYILNKLVKMGLLERHGYRYAPLGLKDVIANYLKGGEYDRYFESKVFTKVDSKTSGSEQ